MVTTKQIKVSEVTKERLDSLKIYERETYEDVLVRLISDAEENIHPEPEGKATGQKVPV